MAPITRHGSSMIRTPGYETLGNTLAGRATHNAMAYDQNTTIDEIQGFDLLSPNLLVPESYDEAIHPLRAAADRVGREVEKFAEELDRHDPRKHTAYSSERYDAATDLADRYIAIAQDTANRLYKKHAPKHQNQLHHRWRRQIEALRNDGEQAGLGESIFEAPSDDDEASSTASGTNVTTVKDLEHWQHEERTWILFKDLLEFRFAPPQAEVRERKRQQMAEIGPIHRFSSERKIWNRFIIEDDLARERQVVLTWLEDTAESSGNDLDMVVEQLEGGVKRGKGLWAQGWLYTKEAIKAKKRLGSWSRPGELGSPGITPNLANTDEIEALVTQLDPDAAVRQGQVLKKEDAYYERATWLACWELLRRGKSWEEIRDWCEDRVEGWRAVSLRGSMRSWDQGLDDDGQLSQSESDDDDHEDDGISQLSRSSGHRDGALWRRMCYAISQKGGMNDYERAVYGTQAGDLNSVLKVCRSWDDFLFAHYKSLLLCQFDAYLQAQYPDRLSPALTGKFKMSSASQLQSEVSSAGRAGQIVVAGLISNPMTMSETARPLKIIQGVLVSSTLLDFVQYQGRQISRIANEDVTKPSEIIPVLPESPEPSHISSPIDVTDFDCLRVLTHILLLSQDLGLEIGQGDDRVAVENILVAYIDFLKLAGKLAIIPMYASRLSPERQLMTLGRVLVDETAAPQRRELIRLMYSYDIEVPRVVEVQMKSILNELGASTHSETENLDHPSLILSSETKIPSMKSNFLGKEITLEDERLIRAFQWYLELEGHWKQTFAMGAYVYKRFFELGHLSAARELIGIMPSSLISTTKTSSIIGRTFDINNLLPDDEGEDESLGPTIKARSTRSLQQVAQDQWTERRGTFERLRRQVEVLRSQAKIYIGLEQLTMALMALQEWEMIKDGAPAPSELTAARHWKEDLGVQFQEIEMAMYPLLHGWLTDIPKDETAEIDSIRNKYLPEIILAYNSVIIFMGATVSNNILLSSMELSTIVAAPDSDILPCIVASGHLQNLVRSFAVASKTMVTASKGQKRNKSAKKSATGQTMALWQVKP